MWRTVIVSSGSALSLKDGWLVVSGEQGEQRVPVKDIYALVVDNPRTMMSIEIINALTAESAHIIYCDKKHIPSSICLPLNNHYKPFGVLQRQLSLTQAFKDLLWQEIVVQKITNQSNALQFAGVNKEKGAAVLSLAADVQLGDKTNREAVAAKKYFQSLFGLGFQRCDENDVTNAALNYGYAIIRSAVSKTLVAYGYNCNIGLHHIGQSNPFNLADDLMEPLRPLVDLWVDNNCEDLFTSLTTDNKHSLIALVNRPILLDGKKMRIRYAIDRYVASFTSAIEGGSPDLLKIPVLIRLEEYFEDELDG